MRRAELAGLVAIAADLGMGLPIDQALRSAALAGMPTLHETALSRCEVAFQLAARLAFPPDLQAARAMVFEGSDTRGVPGKAPGDAVDPGARVTLSSHDVELFYRLAGADAVLAEGRIVKQRR
jgi:hypothetical protein